MTKPAEKPKSNRETQLADYRTPPLLRQWYVAGMKEDFGEELQELIIADRSLVKYRTSKGEPVILQNRCAHRSFPLSKSWREDDDIRCRYHGAKFNCDGELIEVPSQDMCPKKSIRKYPTREHGPFVWVWMAPCEPDDSALPELPFASGDWTVVTGKFDVNGNLMFMAENLCDLSHIPFMHRDTLGYPQEFAKEPLEINKNGDSLEFLRAVKGAYYHNTAFFSAGTGEKIGKHNYTVTNKGYFKSTGWNYSHIKLSLDPETANKDEEVQENYNAIISHFLTPKTASSCHYYWALARDYDQGDEEISKVLVETTCAGFEEDVETTEDLQLLVDTDQTEFKEITFGGDTLSTMMRRIVKRLADEEEVLFSGKS